MLQEIEKYKRLTVILLVILLSLVTLYFVIIYILPLIVNVTAVLSISFLPFILAVVIAIIVDPIVDFLVQKKRINRSIAVTLTLALFLSSLILLIVFFASRLVIELIALYKELPHFTSFSMDYLIVNAENFRTFITNNPLPLEAQEALRNNIEVIVNKAAGIVAVIIDFIFNLLTGLPGFVTIVIVSGIATFFISKDKRMIVNFIHGLTPQKLRKPFIAVIGEINTAIVGFFRAQIILISISTILAVSGLYFLRIHYALTLGLIIGFFDLLPVLGPGTVLVPWALFNFVSGNMNLGISLLVLYAVIVSVRQLIEPKIISQQIGIHPLATLMSLYLGLKLIGMSGIIIGPFLLIVGKAVIKGYRLRD